jgi:hypothetical protein
MSDLDYLFDDLRYYTENLHKKRKLAHFYDQHYLRRLRKQLLEINRDFEVRYQEAVSRGVWHDDDS